MLIVAIGYFWPRVTPRKEAEVPVHLAQELGGWFRSASTLQTDPSRFILLLQAVPLARPLPEKKEFQMGYSLMGREGPLYESSVPCAWATEKTQLEVVVPNPHRVAPLSIRLFIAR